MTAVRRLSKFLKKCKCRTWAEESNCSLCAVQCRVVFCSVVFHPVLSSLFISYVTYLSSNPAPRGLSGLRWLSLCLLEGKGEEIRPLPSPDPWVSAPASSMWRLSDLASAEESCVQESITWLSRPDPRKVTGSAAALPASYGVLNLHWGRISG